VRELQINRLFCKPICKPDAAGQDETGGDGADGARWDLCCPPRSPYPRETTRDAGDVCRMAYNPEVEGSNPSPATKARGPFSNRERAFCMWFVHGCLLK
jgi:hypothetical protein